MPASLPAAAALIPILYLIAVGPSLVVTDLRYHRLPNRMVVPGIAVGAVAAVLQASAVPAVAAATYGGFLLLLGIGGGVGMGDVKLAVVLGLASPTPAIAVASPVLAFLLGGVTASIALIRRGRGVRIAFGPAMIAGYGVALLVATVSGSPVGAP